MSSHISLKELAERLGVAPSTVSRALKNHPDISKETKARIQQMAAELHYAPDAIASGLRNRRVRLVAAIVPEFASDYFVRVLQGALHQAWKEGYNLVVFDSAEEYEREVAICNTICKSGVQGIIIAMTKTTCRMEHFQNIVACKVPLVFFDRIAGNIYGDRIVEDHFRGAYDAVEYMLKGGCRRIVHLAGDQHLQTAQKRQMGYLQALADNHVPVDRSLIIPCNNREEAITQTTRLLAERPVDGIFAFNDWIAVGAMQVLKEKGYRIPDDVAVCGFSDEPVGQVTEPALTTVRQYGYELGEKAIELLMGRLSERDHSEIRTSLLKTSLVIRKSTREVPGK